MLKRFATDLIKHFYHYKMIDLANYLVSITPSKYICPSDHFENVISLYMSLKKGFKALICIH